MATAQIIRKPLAVSYGAGTALFRGVDTTGGQVLVEGVGGVNRLQFVRNDDSADVAHVSGWSKTTGGSFVEVARVAMATRSASAGAGEIALSVKAPAGSLTTTLLLDEKLSVVLGSGALVAAATDGFVYVPTVPATPVGTPTTHAGRAPVVVDTAGNKLWFYSGAAWREAGSVPAIDDTEVAVGSGPGTIAGHAAFTYASATGILSVPRILATPLTSFTDTSGTANAHEFNATIAPTSGNASIRALRLNYTVNRPGSSGFTSGISISATETDKGSGSHLPFSVAVTTSASTKTWQMYSDGAFVLTGGDTGTAGPFASAGGLRYERTLNKLQYFNNVGTWKSFDDFATGSISIAAGQVAVGTGANAIGGDATLTYTGGQLTVGTPETTVIGGTPVFRAFAAGAAYQVLRDSTSNVEFFTGVDGGGGYFGTATNHTLYIFTNNAVAARISAAGSWNIGGATAPTERLEVNGGGLKVAGNVGISSGAGVYIGYASDIGTIHSITPGAYKALRLDALSVSVRVGATTMAEVAAFDVSSTWYRMRMPQANSTISFGTATTIGAPTALSRFKVILLENALEAFAYGLGVESDHMWLQSGSTTGGFKFYSSGGFLRALITVSGLALFGETNFRGGTGVVAIPNRTTAPTSNPSGGGILYAEDGLPAWRDPDGNFYKGWS